MWKRKRLDIQKSSNKITIFFVILFFFILIIGFIFYSFLSGYFQFKNAELIKKEQIIEIVSGENFLSLSDKLQIDRTYLKIYLKYNIPDFELQAGNYKFTENSNIEGIIKSLKTPIILEEKNITILEGWNIYDTDEKLYKEGLIEKGNYVAYVTNQEKIEKLTEFFPYLQGIYTLEGFLYPDTYKINIANFQINNFVIQQLDNFEEKAYEKILSDLGTAKIYELLKLASIVEKEERKSENRPIVAGILQKRLDEGWMLGADITVCYPHKLTSEQCKMVVSKYIQEKSEYNTRTMTGLPKTPIGNPSFDAINTTLHYKKTPYYYYLHDTTTGKIYYGTTNAEHEQNKALYLK